MSKTCYDPKFDYQIIEIIENEGETRFNTLCDLLDKGPKIISRHLDFLANDQKILEWTKNPHGVKGSIRLTTTTKIKRKYGIFSIDYSHKRGLCSDWRKHHVETNKQSGRKAKLMIFLLFVLASGYMSYKNSSKGGGIVIRGSGNDAITTKTVAITDEPEYGFSPDDLIRDDYQLSIIHASMRLNRFSKEEAEDLLNEIREYKDIIELKPISYYGKIKSKIKDETLQDFLIYCSNIITTLVQVLRAYFFFITKQKQKEAIQWFYNILGDELATMFFTKIDENKAKRKSFEDLYIEFYEYDKQQQFFYNDKDYKKYIDQIIQSCKTLDKDFFTKKKLEYRFLGKNNPNSLVAQLVMDSEDINQRQEKYEHPTEKNSRYPFIQLKNKYPFLFESEELKNLVNPPFSRKWFKINLFD